MSEYKKTSQFFRNLDTQITNLDTQNPNLDTIIANLDTFNFLQIREVFVKLV